MERPLQIGIIGDRRSGHDTHVATDAGLQHAAAAIGIDVEAPWLATDAMPDDASLRSVDAFLCAPGSPYRDMEGALRAIRFARENDVPFLGTCGGFQHAVIEIARNVAGIADAEHEEYDLDRGVMVVSALACSLYGKTLPIRIEENTRARHAYGVDHVEERHYCSFGLNPDHQDVLVRAGLRISGRGEDDEPRIIELPDHRFHLATLFVPQARSTPDEPHPIVTGLVEAACERCAARIAD